METKDFEHKEDQIEKDQLLQNEIELQMDQKENNKEDIKEKDKKDIQKDISTAMLLFLAAQFIGAASTIYLKVIQKLYEKTFYTQEFLMYSHIFIMAFSLADSYYSKDRILWITEIPCKLAFYYRINMKFISTSFNTISIWYLRATTVGIIKNLSPIFVIAFSIIFLSEKYYNRYTIGVILCTIGCIIIIMYENKSVKIVQNTDKYGTLKGFILSFSNLINKSLIILTKKIIAVNKISISTQMFYVSLCTGVYSFLFVSLYYRSFKLDLTYIGFIFIDSFLYYLNSALTNMALLRAPLSTLSVCIYSQIVFIFILNFLILGESIYMTDIIGCSIILSYLIYDNLYPIKTEK